MLETQDIDAKLAQAESSTTASKLTPSEILFADLVSRGAKLFEAFVKSHPQSKSVQARNQQAISVAANRVLNRPHVKAYLETLRQPSVVSALLTREAKRAKLAELVQTCPDPAIVLRAIDIDNDMAGDRAPKTSVSLSPSLAIADKLLTNLASKPELPAPKQVTELPHSIPPQTTP